MLKIVLDLPPSANKRLTIASNQKRLIFTSEHRNWMNSAAWKVRSQLNATTAQEVPLIEPITSNCLTLTKVTLKDNRKRDYDNIAKCVNDALQQGGAIANDNLITRAFWYFAAPDKQNGGSVEVCLFLLDDLNDMATASTMINQVLIS